MGALTAVHCPDVWVSSCTSWDACLVAVYCLDTLVNSRRGCESDLYRLHCLDASAEMTNICWIVLKMVEGA